MHNPEPKTRPVLLTWMCIFSGIVGSLWIVMFLVMFSLSLKRNGPMPAGLFPGLVLNYLHAGYVFMVIEIFLTGMALAGVLLMWQMRKTGFYLYAFTKSILYFLPAFYIGSHHLTYPGLILTSLPIILYGIVFTHYQKD